MSPLRRGAAEGTAGMHSSFSVNSPKKNKNYKHILCAIVHLYPAQSRPLACLQVIYRKCILIQRGCLLWACFWVSHPAWVLLLASCSRQPFTVPLERNKRAQRTSKGCSQGLQALAAQDFLGGRLRARQASARPCLPGQERCWGRDGCCEDDAWSNLFRGRKRELKAPRNFSLRRKINTLN